MVEIIISVFVGRAKGERGRVSKGQAQAQGRRRATTPLIQIGRVAES